MRHIARTVNNLIDLDIIPFILYLFFLKVENNEQT